jgi:hypothetical protein
LIGTVNRLPVVAAKIGDRFSQGPFRRPKQIEKIKPE